MRPRAGEIDLVHVSGSEPEWSLEARRRAVTEKYPDITVEFQTLVPGLLDQLPALAAAGKLPDIISLQSLRAPVSPADGAAGRSDQSRKI